MEKTFVKPKGNIGVSQFAAALGLSDKFLTADQLKDQIENGYYREPNAATDFGHCKEESARKYYEKIKKCQVVKARYKSFDQCSRLMGICDGLIGENGGLEIKCHYNYTYPLQNVPIYYLVQVAGYLYLYNRDWFDFMSCCFDEKGEIKSYNIIRISKDEVKDQWEENWFPKLIQYTNSINWKI